MLPLALIAAAALGAIDLKVEPEKASPGDLVMLTVRGASAPPSGRVADRELAFFPVGSDAVAGEAGAPGASTAYRAVFGLPVEQPLGSLELAISARNAEGADEVAKATLELTDPGWPTRELKVESKFIEPPPEVQAQIEADREAFKVAFEQALTPPLFKSEFGWPRQAKVTARFGDQRTFNGKLASQHYGTDLRGGIGAPIRATNDGQVVMVRECYHSGKTVIVHHGQNLFSLYFHLSKISVSHGAAVKKGQLLGRVGSTGRSTGPHLHWSMKVGDLYVDPESLLRLRFFPAKGADGGAGAAKTKESTPAADAQSSP